MTKQRITKENKEQPMQHIEEHGKTSCSIFFRCFSLFRPPKKGKTCKDKEDRAVPYCFLVFLCFHPRKT